MTDNAPSLRAILDELEPKPSVSADRVEKHGYAMALSRKLAVFMANALRPTYPSVVPKDDDSGHESTTGAATGTKRADVKVWDDVLGLLLLVSLKTYSFQDWDSKKQKAGRYSKNVKRNALELKDEADVIHRRQPYSVIVAIMFIPMSACLDGDPAAASDDRGLSSFASIVKRLRARTGRALDPDEKRFDRYDLTEHLYIGLYEYDEPDRGAVFFFDVAENPPKTGRPARGAMLSVDELVAEVSRMVKHRNSAGIEWAVLADDVDEDDE